MQPFDFLRELDPIQERVKRKKILPKCVTRRAWIDESRDSNVINSPNYYRLSPVMVRRSLRMIHWRVIGYSIRTNQHHQSNNSLNLRRIIAES